MGKEGGSVVDAGEAGMSFGVSEGVCWWEGRRLRNLDAFLGGAGMCRCSEMKKKDKQVVDNPQNSLNKKEGPSSYNKAVTISTL